jgi:ketosteroid isomerase-like protein
VLLQSFEEFRQMPERFIDCGDRVMVFTRIEARGRSSGLDINEQWAHLLTLRDGKIVRLQQFRDRDEGLEAAGLSESAMSEENVEVVRKSIDAVNRGDSDAWLGFLSPEVVWESLPLPGFRDVYRGRAEAREWRELLLEVFEEARLEIEETMALSDERVLIGFTQIGRGRGSGLPLEYPTWAILWVADGLITRRQVFRTRDEALEAAGLSE